MAYSTVAGLGILLAGLLLVGWWLARRERAAATAARNEARAEDAARKAVAHAHVAAMRDRDPAPLPGGRLRDVDKPVRD